MKKGVNKAIIMGNVGGDPEIRYSPAGLAITRFSVATNSSWNDSKDGQEKQITDWHRVVFFGKPAEIIKEYVRKGSAIYIEGTIRYGQYEKEGVTHKTTDIIGREFQFLDSANSARTPNNEGAMPNNSSYNQPPASPNNNAQQANTQQASGFSDNFEDDEIPF